MYPYRDTLDTFYLERDFGKPIIPYEGMVLGQGKISDGISQWVRFCGQSENKLYKTDRDHRSKTDYGWKCRTTGCTWHLHILKHGSPATW